MQKVFLLLAALSGVMAVMLGAMGAHWLKDKLNYWELHTFETGVRYQMYHTLALIGVVVLIGLIPSRFVTWAGFAFVLGIALFSGSLYLLSVKDLFLMPSLGMLGPITPIGGFSFMIGWSLLALSVIATWKER